MTMVICPDKILFDHVSLSNEKTRDIKKELDEIDKFPLAPMGVLDPVSVHVGPSARPPIGTSGNFPARLSAESISPNFPIFLSKYG